MSPVGPAASAGACREGSESVPLSEQQPSRLAGQCYRRLLPGSAGADVPKGTQNFLDKWIKLNTHIAIGLKSTVEYNGCKENEIWLQHIFLSLSSIFWKWLFYIETLYYQFMCKERTSNFLIRELVFHNQDFTFLEINKHFLCDMCSWTEKFQLSSSVGWTGIDISSHHSVL